MLPIKPSHTGKMSVDQDTNTIMDIAPFNSRAPSPLGNFSVFPREIRDEIYRHFFSESYSDWYCTVSRTHRQMANPYYLGSGRNSFSRSSLSILCLSRAIKEEGKAVLYPQVMFSFYFEMECPFEEVPPHLSTDNMTKIRLFYDATQNLVWNGLKDYGSAGAGQLCFFLGDTIMRKSILVDLELGGNWHDATEMTESPLFSALGQLTGFETVTLSLSLGDDEYGQWPDDGEWGELYAGFGTVLGEMSKYLEPTLGRSSAMSERSPEAIGPWHPDSVIREVVFHPRAYRAAISKAKQDK